MDKKNREDSMRVHKPTQSNQHHLAERRRKDERSFAFTIGVVRIRQAYADSRCKFIPVRHPSVWPSK